MFVMYLSQSRPVCESVVSKGEFSFKTTSRKIVGGSNTIHLFGNMNLILWMYIVNCTLNCTLYIVHCTLHIVHVHCTCTTVYNCVFTTCSNDIMEYMNLLILWKFMFTCDTTYTTCGSVVYNDIIV